jgi:hypothetical protein
MTGGTDDMALPLALFNPMSKAHVTELLDTLIAFDAEKVAADALADAERRLDEIDAAFRVGLVVVDDAAGGWTNRHLTDSTHRFGGNGELKRGWITVLLWSSETPSKVKVREETLANVYRSMYVKRHGAPKTLREMIAQEGLASAFARANGPVLDSDELAYAREVIEPHLDSTNYATAFACLYGDDAAVSVGYSSMGLPDRAGFAVALADAVEGGTRPEESLNKKSKIPPEGTLKQKTSS